MRMPGGCLTVCMKARGLSGVDCRLMPIYSMLPSSVYLGPVGEFLLREAPAKVVLSRCPVICRRWMAWGKSGQKSGGCIQFDNIK